MTKFEIISKILEQFKNMGASPQELEREKTRLSADKIYLNSWKRAVLKKN